MSLGSYKTPAPFKDEDKWFRFFTKKALCYVITAIVLGVLQFLFFLKLHLTLIGMTIFVILLAAAFFLAFGEMPMERYLFGGGERMETLVVRILLKRLKRNRCIFVKNYEDKI